MAPALLLALTLAAYLGFALLALSQHRHWQRAGGALPCPARLIVPMLALSYGLLLTALALALLRDGEVDDCGVLASLQEKTAQGLGYRLVDYRLFRRGRYFPGR